MVDQETWMNRFANLWLAYHREQDVVHSIEPVEERPQDHLMEEIKARSFESNSDREEWLQKYAQLWVACEKNPATVFKNKIGSRAVEVDGEPGVKSEEELFTGTQSHSACIAAELGKGRVVIGDCTPVGEDSSIPGLKPDDILVFDIDPERAIKLLTASKEMGS